MRNIFLKTLKVVRWMLIAFVSIVLTYVFIVWIIPKVSVNAGEKSHVSDGVDIYILTNGVHTDIVMPLETEWHDWRSFVNPIDTKAKDPSMKFSAFGWGDKGFYLDTPTWADLKFSTAFKAAFWLGTSAMHVTYYKEMREGDRCRRIRVSKDDYLKMVEFVLTGFQKDSTGHPKLLVDASYDQYDAFYDGNGTYNLFFTCNTWANNALKAGNQKACLWAARQEDIFSKYD